MATPKTTDISPRRRRRILARGAGSLIEIFPRPHVRIERRTVREALTRDGERTGKDLRKTMVRLNPRSLNEG